jgi:hypothetical protein
MFRNLINLILNSLSSVRDLREKIIKHNGKSEHINLKPTRFFGAKYDFQFQATVKTVWKQQDYLPVFIYSWIYELGLSQENPASRTVNDVPVN